MLQKAASMYAALQAPEAQTLLAKPIKVMIVDDSAVIRGLVSRWIEEEPDLEVVARHANGQLAVDDVVRSTPDIVRGAAAPARGASGAARADGLDVDVAQCRDQLQGLGAWRSRLRSQTRLQ
jgi:hypothetical protein